VTVTTEVTLRRNHNALFVHLVVPSASRLGGLQTVPTFYMDEAVEICGAAVSLRLPSGQSCISASQLGQPLEVSADKRAGYVCVRLQPFATHTAVRFDLNEA